MNSGFIYFNCLLDIRNWLYIEIINLAQSNQSELFKMEIWWWLPYERLPIEPSINPSQGL